MYRARRTYRKPDFIFVLILAVVISLSVTVAFQLRDDVQPDTSPVAEKNHQPSAMIIGG